MQYLAAHLFNKLLLKVLLLLQKLLLSSYLLLLRDLKQSLSL